MEREWEEPASGRVSAARTGRAAAAGSAAAPALQEPWLAACRWHWVAQDRTGRPFSLSPRRQCRDAPMRSC